MENFEVKRDGEKTLRFTGEKIAWTSSSWESNSSDFSGSNGRRAKLRLYRTKAGKFVCQRIEESQWQGEVTRYSGAYCDTPEQVFDFFGANRFAKELYDEAELDFAEDVE